jgi:hypothetical protein
MKKTKDIFNNFNVNKIILNKINSRRHMYKKELKNVMNHPEVYLRGLKNLRIAAINI